MGTVKDSELNFAVLCVLCGKSNTTLDLKKGTGNPLMGGEIVQFEEEEKEKGWCRMKKLLASLLVLAMCAPAMALTFSTSATDNVLTINYNLAAGEGLRGLALTINQVGAGDAAVTDVDAGAFNTFMDYAYTAGDQYTIDPDNQHPVALIDGPGAATLPAAAAGGFSLSMGYLDENGVEPKGEAITTSGSIVVTFDGTIDTEVAVALDTLRGGAVGDELATIDDSGLQNVQLTFGPACKGDYNASNTITSADISLVVNYWLTNKNMFGVAQCNLAGYVDGMDLNASNTITSADISLVVNHWLSTKTMFGVSPCMP